MNALFVLRPAKLWAFNIGHPCPSLAKGELNVIVLRPNFQQTSNQSRTIIKLRPFRYPAKIRNVIKGRNNPAHFRPPSTQLKPISIFLKGEFEAAHSRKVDFATAHSRHKICIAPSLNPDRSAIPQKSATLSKVGICRAPRALTVGRLSCRLAFLSFPSQDTGRLSTCRKPHRLCFGFRPRCSFQS